MSGARFEELAEKARAGKIDGAELEAFAEEAMIRSEIALRMEATLHRFIRLIEGRAE